MTSHCGLHSIIGESNNSLNSHQGNFNYIFSLLESEPGETFLCLYEPRTIQAVSVFNRESPEYDLELSVKLFSDPLGSYSQKAHIVFSLESPENFMTLTADVGRKTWSLHWIRGSDISVIAELEDASIRPGVFYAVLIQLRSGTVSVDIDGSPFFTSVKLPDRVSGNSLVGVLSKNSKFAIKSWKIRGDSRSVNKNVDSVFTSQLEQQQDRPIMHSSSLSSSSSVVASKGPKSLSAYISTGSTSSATSRLGPVPVPVGGGGPGKPKNLTYSDLVENGIDNDASDEEGVRERKTPISAMVSTDKGIPGGSDPRFASSASILLERYDKAIVQLIMYDIVQRDLGVTFDDIAALTDAKRLLNEAIVLPLLMPEFFTGIREPWKGVLLFGPPGTGKTLLAKAVAGINSSTFFCCSASSLISKFRGESEKLVRCLFDAARLCAPSIIFLDEVDALASARGVDGEHEASRRMKTEFFTQMDGVASSRCGTDERVIVLCATNCPWDLDEALRRRLEKRIYIPLPDVVARIDMFSICLRDIPVDPNINIAELAVATDGYSCADIHIVCREASMAPMRKLLATYSPERIKRLRANGLLSEIPRVEAGDFNAAIRNTKPSVGSTSIFRFEQWDTDFGSK